MFETNYNNFTKLNFAQSNKTSKKECRKEKIRMSVYDYEYISIENEPVKMSEYQGKVLLIVNTVSKCGFTPQYEGLEALYEKYRERGVEIIGFPCNQFMEQEPGSEKEIAEFCTIRYGVTFPLSQKVDVRDETAIPLYKYLTDQKGFEGLGKGAKEDFVAILKKRADGISTLSYK